VQIGNSSGPAFGGLFSKKDEKAEKAHHGHGAKHAHHVGHNKKHKPQFGAITGSGGADTFQKR